MLSQRSTGTLTQSQTVIKHPLFLKRGEGWEKCWRMVSSAACSVSSFFSHPIVGSHIVIMKLYYCLIDQNYDHSVSFTVRKIQMISWFLGVTSAKSMCFLLWTVRAVKGSDQVRRVYLQLSNLDFWAWLRKPRDDNNLWLTNKTRSGVYRPFGTRSIHILMCPSFTLTLLTGTGVCSVVFQLTRWVHDAKRGSTPMKNIQFIMCEVCYLNGARVVCWATRRFPL